MTEMLKKLREHLKNRTPEQIEADKKFFKDDRPKGWLSIEDHLPMMLAVDIMVGCTKFKVKYKDGTEGETCVSDHNIWYYEAKESGITHWFNK